MRPLRAAAAIVAVALAATAAPAAKAGPVAKRFYVLTGSRTSYVDVAFYTPMTFKPPVVETRGRYGGFYVEQLVTQNGTRGTNHGGWVAMRGLSADAKRMDPLVLNQPATVQPGMVRLYLIADGPTTVRIERDGGPQGTVGFRPAERASAHGGVAPLKGSGGVWSGSVPLQVGPGSVALAAVQVTGAASIASDVTVCVRPPHDACPVAPLVRLLAEPGLTDPLNPEQRWVSSPPLGAGLVGRVVAYGRVQPVDPLSRAVVAGFVLRLAPL